MKKIIIAGGTGNIGKSLIAFLSEKGYQIVVLSRSQQGNINGVEYVLWDGESLGDWTTSLENADAVINLSGKSIQCRFTEKNKKELLNSRILPTKVIGKAIQSLTKKPRLWINFSGISIFEGITTMNDERSETYGTGFLAELTKQWEQAFFDAEIESTRKVCLRISPVLSRTYGMFKELYPLTKMGLGGQVADGRQFVSWIHEEDLMRMVLWVLMRQETHNVYHACSPYPETNAKFMKEFRAAVGVSLGVPLPAFFARVGALVKGVEPTLLLESLPVTTKLTLEEGFIFKFPYLRSALTELITSP